ncbi:fibronectin type III-like domain-contianing protein [Anaerocolumna sedimenticola]|uniref:fibronectin type III-like domain-contianing protein n=1 Tax=Anaerocolumna sedimenticola TaxID=2696063 RepID=UPI001FEB64FA|nr:fibronectin type III-like domain-contianing protein [Anaerocolumna sedimenticola]
MEQTEETLQVKVSITITNVGKLPGAQVIQIYTGCAENVQKPVERPQKDLKAFQKISLNPGERGRVTKTLDGSAFAYYSPTEKCFVVEPGEYTIYIATSSADIIETHKIKINNKMKYSK